MRCGTARRLLWPGMGPQAITDAIETAQAHQRTCEACRRFVAAQEASAAQLSKLADGPIAPAAVRERIFNRLARERVGRSAQTLRTTAVGVSIVAAGLLIAGGFWVTDAKRHDSDSQQQLVAVAEDHVRSRHAESIAATDVATVQRWVAGRAPFAVHIPLMPGAALQGARLCYMDGRRGVVLRYQVDGRELSYYIMPAEPSSAAPIAREQFLHGAQRGYQVVAWHDLGLVHALVADLPEDRLLQLARSCANRSAAKEKSSRSVATVAARSFDASAD